MQNHAVFSVLDKCIDFWYDIFVEKEYLEVLTENRPKPLKKGDFSNRLGRKQWQNQGLKQIFGNSP